MIFDRNLHQEATASFCNGVYIFKDMLNGYIDDAKYFLGNFQEEQRVSCHQQRLRAAGEFAKCSHSVAAPTCMNRLNVDSADSAVSTAVLCSFLLGLKQIKKYDFSLFYKL